MSVLADMVCQGGVVSIMSARPLGGRYQLHTTLGQGGMAAVWAGVDIRLGRPVAVKVLDGAARADPVMLQRLEAEARTVAKLEHPNIVAVYDFGTEGDVPYLVMELVEGEDLQQRLANGPLDVRAAVGIAAQICDALEAAHQAGVVHRDVKPANILITAAGRVKVCDFGIARLQQSGQARMTSHSTMVGTSEYMAPEQASGGPMDGRTDLYGLGCVLYAMLTGGPPFSGDNPMGVVWQQVHRPAAPVASLRAGVPADLDSLVARLLAKSPADRPASAGEVRDQLARVLPGLASDFAGVHRAGGVAQPTAAAVMHGRASVPMRTQTMPAFDVASEDMPRRSGFRLGPVGVTAVAAGVAIVTALLVALFMAVWPEQPVAGTGTNPAGSTSAGAGTSAAATKPVAEAVADVRTVIQAQVAAGELDTKTANDLTNKLDEIERQLSGRDPDRAAGKVDDLRDRLGELRRDGKVSDAGYAAIMASLDQLASALPSAGTQGGDD